ncbi:GNAT family N-acetyltransferase [Streptomyces sp. NPDC016309]|uniref:GNAT family N-acetyltransferase n=1 Tax=Streptomyces sp. NPDC016309 TaxID=3364965 RepID=UPI0036F749E2
MTISAPHDGTLEYREARPEDLAGAEGIDSSFTTDRTFTVVDTGSGFSIVETPVDPPLRKEFPDDDGEGDGDENGDGDPAGAGTLVAVDGTRVCGYVTTTYQEWNRRLTVADLAVSPDHRGRGIGAELLRRTVERARARGASHVWLEVTHVNAPAIRLYRRAGFTFCGLDTSLYEGTESAGETALYMSRRC